MHSLKRALSAVFFPPRCPFCRTAIFPSQMLCDACAVKYPPNCRTVAVPIAGEPQNCVGVYDYSVARDAIASFKFRSFPSAARGFALMMAEQIRQQHIRADCVTFVPMTPMQQRLRGYNQAELLAKELATALNLPCVPLIKKVRKTKTQHMISRAERLQNLRGAYKALPKAADKQVILCDDIFTTGSTMLACTEALRAVGCTHIFEIVVAIA